MTGEEMKAARLQLGYTQAQLASLIGGRPSMVSDYENGRKKITDKLALILALFLEVKKLGSDVEAVVSRSQKKRRPN